MSLKKNRSRKPAALWCYLLAEDAAPPGPLEAAAPPPEGAVLEAAPPLDEDVPPVPLGLELELDALPGELGVLDELELEEPGAGTIVVEDDDEPPGTTIVSFSFVTVLVPPPGTTAVVSLRSHAERARAPANINR